MNAETVLITGSNRGIGLGLVRQFLQLESPPRVLIAACRNPHQAQDLQALSKDNSNLKILKLDVSQLDEASLARMKQEVEDLLDGRGLNLLINNAGVLSMEEPSIDRLTSSFTVNAFAPLLITSALMPLLKLASSSHPDQETLSANRACVVCMSSQVASITNTTETESVSITYKGSQAAMNMFMKFMSVEFDGAGVLFLLRCPGVVHTDMLGDHKDRVADLGYEVQTVDEACTKLIKNIGQASNKDQGSFLDNTREVLPW